MFYILRVIYHPEVSEGDEPITDEAWVIFQDRLQRECGEIETWRPLIEGRFRNALGDDVKDTDKVTVVDIITDPMMLRVLKAWDRTAIDGPTGLFNLGTP